MLHCFRLGNALATNDVIVGYIIRNEVHHNRRNPVFALRSSFEGEELGRKEGGIIYYTIHYHCKTINIFAKSLHHT